MIWVIGAGAVGTLLAARLSRAGVPVRLIVRTEERARVLREGVDIVDPFGRVERVALDCVGWNEVGKIPVESAAAVWIATKTYQLRGALESLRQHADLGDLNLVFMQNGLGILEDVQAWFPGISSARMIRATAWWGGRFTGPTQIFSTQVQGIEWAGRAVDEMHASEPAFARAGIPLREEADPKVVEWRKALSNLTINGLCALAQVPNRAVVENSKLRDLAEMLLEESVRVAQAQGVVLGPQDRARVFEIALATGDNLNSTLLDLQSGRPTEIPWLNGRVVLWGGQYGVPTPGNRLVAGLIDCLQEKVENVPS